MELPLLLDSKQVLELLAMSNWNAHFRLEISFGKFALIFMTSCFSRKFPFRKTKLNRKVTCKRESAEIVEKTCRARTCLHFFQDVLFFPEISISEDQTKPQSHVQTGKCRDRARTCCLNRRSNHQFAYPILEQSLICFPRPTLQQRFQA